MPDVLGLTCDLPQKVDGGKVVVGAVGAVAFVVREG